MRDAISLDLVRTRRPHSAARFVAVLLPALIAFACAAIALDVLRMPRASLGFGVMGLRIAGVAPDSQAERAGMQRGDSLEPSTPLSVRLRVMWYDAYRPGQTETLSFGRDGRFKTVTLTAVEHRPPFSYRNEVLIVLRTFVYLALLIIGAWLVLLRPARFTWGFYACIIGLAPFPAFVGWSFTALHPLAGLAAYCFWTAVADIANVGFLIFALRFPTDEARGWRAAMWRSLPLWLVAFVALDAWALLDWYRGIALPAAVLWGPAALAFAAWAVGSAALLSTYGHADLADRRRLQWAIVGSSLGYFAWFAYRALSDLHLFTPALIAGFAISILPLSVAYAVLRHRMFDVRFVVNRALALAVLGSLLVALFALSWWFGATVLARSPLDLPLQIVVALFAGASLMSMQRRLERWIEGAVFHRLRDVERALANVRERFAAAQTYATLDALLAREPLDILELEFSAMYRRDDAAGYLRTVDYPSGKSGPLELQGNEVDAVRTAVPGEPLRWVNGATAVPIGGFAGTPAALAIYGPHRSGFALDPDEVALLAAFAASAAPVYAQFAERSTRARSIAQLLRPLGATVDASFSRDVAAHVLHELAQDDRLVLATCVALPNATVEEVAFLTDGAPARARLLELAATTPLVTQSEEGFLTVHPLLHDALWRQVAHRSHSDILRVAAWRMANGGFERAAELYVATGDHVRALAAFSEAYRSDSPHERIGPAVRTLLGVASVDEVAASLDVVLAYVREEWLVSNEPLLREKVVAALERADLRGSTRAEVTGWLAYAYCRAGLARRAETAAALADPDACALVLAMLAAQRGRLEDCNLYLDAFDENATVAGSALPISALVRAAMCSDRLAFDEARALLEGAVANAPRARVRLLVESELLILDWLEGDWPRLQARAAALSEWANALHAPAIDDLACAPLGGSASDEPYPYIRAGGFTALMRACVCRDPVTCADYLNTLLRGAMLAGEPFLACLAEVALSQTVASESFDHAARAVALAESLNAPLLSDAIEHALDDQPAGPLASFVKRIRAGGPPRGVAVAIARGEVRSGTEIINLTEREAALLIALAATRSPQASATLIDALWPDMDETAGTKALQTCVYRARLHLGDQSAIESVANGYQLGAGVCVDLLDAEAFVSTLQRTELTPAERIRLEGIARRLDVPRFPASHNWEWYDALERRIRAVVRDAHERLAAYYVECYSPAHALAHARAMISADDIDERAYELAIRAHIAAGDPSAGWHELRQYQRALARMRSADNTSTLAALLSHSTAERLAREG